MKRQMRVVLGNKPEANEFILPGGINLANFASSAKVEIEGGVANVTLTFVGVRFGRMEDDVEQLSPLGLEPNDFRKLPE